MLKILFLKSCMIIQLMDILELKPIQVPKISPDFHKNLRTRFVNQMKSKVADLEQTICFLKGIQTVHKNYDDIDVKPEQESTFWYFLGVKQADCYGIIELDTQKVILFVPKIDEAYKMWMKVASVQQIQASYQVDKVLFVEDMQSYFNVNAPKKIYYFTGIDSDSKLQIDYPKFEYLNQIPSDKALLFDVISNLRAIKTEEQINIMKYVAKIGSQAHLRTMRHTKPGLTQIQLQALFHFDHTIHCGCEHLAFPSICSSGRDCAILHYINNDQIIQPGQLVLHDMGGKWYGYCTDQAITFPVDGKFTKKQAQIYNAVYEAQFVVQQKMREGVQWTDMHYLAERIIIQHLVKLGIIINAQDLEAVQKKRVGAVFFPHGLGHLVGLKVHDLGGYTEGQPRLAQFGVKSLRTRRILKQNVVITVEPGCYFIQHIIQNAFANPDLSHHLCKQKIEEYMEVGGIRLEDVVVVKKEGIQIISDLPRKIEDVEKWLAGTNWKN